MTDYIKREDAIELLNGWNISGRMLLAPIPTADVRENVRGEWRTTSGEKLKTDGQYWLDCKCTACGEYANQATDFCPNCGADMRTADSEQQSILTEGGNE